jgi:sugar phosphate isomerase/epimerase
VKPITWLRKFAERGYAGYPVATLAFYGPDDRKATKAVLGIIETEGVEPRLHTWGGETADKDLHYDLNLQNELVRIIQREGCKSLAMLEEINGCPHQEGINYLKGEFCPKCTFWAGKERPIEQWADSLPASKHKVNPSRLGEA